MSEKVEIKVKPSQSGKYAVWICAPDVTRPGLGGKSLRKVAEFDTESEAQAEAKRLRECCSDR